ncbi:hypothetical protein Clacol_009183 [Clathrus columnatus]|uniref:DUF6535 domain-containing protein n=1 Tax=Clathrus columnatus TaxID=1419009 RepID=A0AAV5AN22_9AGAM|nr:hypothetical protein Clacol_009183 [Clathrus columnatus]
MLSTESNASKEFIDFSSHERIINVNAGIPFSMDHSLQINTTNTYSQSHPSAKYRDLSLDLDTPGMPDSKLLLLKVKDSNAEVIHHVIDINAVDFQDSSNNEAVSLNFTIEEQVKKPNPPRKLPSRFWGREALPGEIDIGQELGDRSLVWERYQTEAKEHDKLLTEGWTGDMDVLLVFAALFSAILTAFIIEFYKQLQPDPTNAFLSLSSNTVVLLRCIANHTECTNLVIPNESIHISESFRWINALWFTSLTISLLVSAVAILVKQWVHAYHSGLYGNPRSYGRLRQFRYDGIKKWRISGIIRALPSLMYLAVILFFVGLLILLSNLDPAIYLLCLSICIVAGSGYLLTLILPVIDPSCPFRTPASGFLDWIYQFFKFYIQMIGLWCIHRVLLTVLSVWNGITAFYSNDKTRWFRSSLESDLNSFDSRLFRSPAFTHITEREIENVEIQSSELEANALAWLSNTNVRDTQHIVMQSISGLSPDIALVHFHKGFKCRRSPSSFLLDAYHNPDSNPSYHHNLTNYAQAYLVVLSSCPDISSTQHAGAVDLLRNSLQWYPSLVALGALGDRPHLPEEMLSQAIKELAEGLYIVTNLSLDDQEWEACSQIITDLILQSILLLYLFYGDDSSVQSRIVDASFETLQIWMRTISVLDCPSRPPYLLSLCSLVQIFAGITSSSQLYQCWFSKDHFKETWILLLRSLVTLPETEQRQDFPSLSPSEFLEKSLLQGDLRHMANSGSSEFRHWRLLHCALLDCSTLLSGDRTTFDLVLKLFLETFPEFWRFWPSEHPFHCLHLISPLFTPEDTVRVLNLFKDSLDKITSAHLCKLLQARCQEASHAEAIMNSGIFEQIIDKLLVTAGFNALWVFATILQTLSQNDSPVLNGAIPHRILLLINLALTDKIEREDPQNIWDYYRHWCLSFSLAASCQRLHQTYNLSTSGTGIIETLRRLSVIAAVSDFRERKEARNFINTVLKLEEWERVH